MRQRGEHGHEAVRRRLAVPAVSPAITGTAPVGGASTFDSNECSIRRAVTSGGFPSASSDTLALAFDYIVWLRSTSRTDVVVAETGMTETTR
ncbi:hypothetical protein LMG24238_07129 [Paraburkholderia sediminicola]|uniref:Uncharacterized protein n=1 Tax=Paraburkholderia sediminicola TaxID=458836 RepID=A0A6J5CRF5_9BURK|nr:hypothetical protein LMG24238_07129 [Paraburkholderia sediminicola]